MSAAGARRPERNPLASTVWPSGSRWGRSAEHSFEDGAGHAYRVAERLGAGPSLGRVGEAVDDAALVPFPVLPHDIVAGLVERRLLLSRVVLLALPFIEVLEPGLEFGD